MDARPPCLHDIFKPVIGGTLTSQWEPENTKDSHAVAIVEDTGALSRIVSSFFKKR